MGERRYHIVLNPSAGAAASSGLTPEQLRQLFEQKGYKATCEPNAPLSALIECAVSSDADVIVAAGGDGTVTALANALVDTDKTLAILPLGTANLLARDLGVPLDLNQAIDALATMRPHRIDVGEVNGRLFIHNVTMGFAPSIAVRREEIRGQGNLSAKIDFLRHFVQRLFQGRRIAIEITPRNGERHVERVRAVTVSNNDYDEAFGRFFARRRLDAGHLTLYLVKRLTFGDFLRLMSGMLIGRWSDDRVLMIETVDEVSVRVKRPSLMATIDGEVATFTVPLKFRIRPLALSVLAPVAEAVEPAAAEPQMAVRTA